MSVSKFDSPEHELTTPEVRHFSIDAVKTVYARLVVAFRPEFARIGMGTEKGPLGMAAAVLLSQGFYWSEAIGDEDGKFTVTQEEIEHSTTLNEYEQRVARRDLVSRGLWTEEKRGEEYEDSRGRKRMSGGRMFYDVQPEAVRVALELLVEMTPGLDGDRRRKKELKEQQRRDWLEAQRAKKQAEKDAKKSGSPTAKTEVHVSQNLQFTNLEPPHEGNGDLCIVNSAIHETQDLQPMKSEISDASTYIEDHQKGKRNHHQEHQQNRENLTPTEAFDDVDEFSISSENSEVIAGLTKCGVTSKVAEQLAMRPGLEVCRAQLDYFPLRRDKNGETLGGGGLRRSIEDNWPPPKEVLARQKAAEKAQNRRAAQESAAAAKEAQNAAEAAQKADLEAETAYLDALWEKLDEKTRANLDKEITPKLGFLANLGRGDAARAAFRRDEVRALMLKLGAPDAPDAQTGAQPEARKTANGGGDADFV